MSRYAACLLTLLLAAVGYAADGERANPLVGCWRNEQKPDWYMRFSDDGRWAQLRGKEHSFGAATVRDRSIAIMSNGLPCARPDFTLVGDRLTLSGASEKDSEVYRRCSEPDGMDPKPVPLGEPLPVEAAALAKIQGELLERLRADQGARTRAPGAAMKQVDGGNTAYLKALVKEVGWIDAERFGQQAAVAAFLIAQHSGDVQLMLAALPSLEQDAKAKRVDGQMFSMLYDRLHLMLESRQRYGSQVFTETVSGKMYVLPLQDRAKVDEARKEIGLVPLAEYLATLSRQNRGKPIGISEE